MEALYLGSAYEAKPGRAPQGCPECSRQSVQVHASRESKLRLISTEAVGEYRRLGLPGFDVDLSLVVSESAGSGRGRGRGCGRGRQAAAGGRGRGRGRGHAAVTGGRGHGRAASRSVD